MSLVQQKCGIVLICLIISFLITFNILTQLIVLTVLGVSLAISFIIICLPLFNVNYKTIAIPLAISEGVFTSSLTYYVSIKEPYIGVLAAFGVVVCLLIAYIINYFKLISIDETFEKNTNIALFGLVGFVIIVLIANFFITVPAFIFTLLPLLAIVVGMLLLICDTKEIMYSKTSNEEEAWNLSVSFLLTIVLLFTNLLEVFSDD